MLPPMHDRAPNGHSWMSNVPVLFHHMPAFKVIVLASSQVAPAGHKSQAVFPGVSAICPYAQLPHVVDPSVEVNFPTAHSSQVDRTAISDAKVPAGQSIHVRSPK